MNTKMNIKIINCGHCIHPEWTIFRQGKFRYSQFPARAIYISHPAIGKILIDTGYSPWFITHTQHFPAILYRYLLPVRITAEESLSNQLMEKYAISPTQIDHIILTHFHGDHIGGLKDFPLAKVHCLKEAYQAVASLRGIKATMKGFIPELCPADLPSRLFFADDCKNDSENNNKNYGQNYSKNYGKNHGTKAQISLPFAEFPTGINWSGDGRIILIELPGHAPGQCGVLLNDPDWINPIFFVSDVSWSSLQNGQLSKRLRSWVSCLMHDRQAYLDTLAKLKRLSISHPQVKIICSHQNELSDLNEANNLNEINELSEVF